MKKPNQTISTSPDKKQKKKSSISKIYGYISKKIENQLEYFKQDKTILNSITTKIDKTNKKASDNQDNQNYQYAQQISFVKEKKKKNIEIRHQQSNQELLSIQINKCYKNIPRQYFDEQFELNINIFQKNKSKAQQKRFQLCDFLDEVNFNLNIQVNNKFSEFIQFIHSMNTMNIMINQNLIKIQKLKDSNKLTQNNICQKLSRIVKLRIKLDNLNKLKSQISNIKRFTNFTLQIKQIFIKDKTKALTLFDQYDDFHQNNKIFCCANKKNECQYQNCKQYLKSNLLVAFKKSFWNYLTQIITYDKSLLKSIFIINKREFQTTPAIFNMNLFQSLELEQSGWEDDESKDIIIKQDIEDQINWIAINGFKLCNFSCDELTQDLDLYLSDFNKGFLNDLIEKIKESFDMSVGNTLFNSSKNEKTLLMELESLIQKITFGKFIKTLELYCQVLKKVIRRSFSMIYKITSSLIHKHMQKSLQFQNNLLKITKITLEFSNQKLSNMIKLKKIPLDFDLNNFKQFMRIFEQWQQFIQLIENTYLNKMMIFNINIEDIKIALKMKSVEQKKKTLFQNYLTNLHKFSINKQLKKAMQEDIWQQVDIQQKFYDIFGYILQGEKFLSQKKNKFLLQSSLLFQKKSSTRTTTEKQENHKFKVTNNQIIIKERRFKITSSTLVLVQIIEQYIKIYDAYPSLSEQVTNKLIELLMYYNSYLCQLILGTTALTFNKIKGKAITARHLSLCYLSLDLLICIISSIKSHLKNCQQQFINLTEKLWFHQQEIIKKFHNIIVYKVNQQIKYVVLQSPTPTKGTLNIVNHIKSMYQILSEYYDDELIKKFFVKECLMKYLERLNKLKAQNLNQVYLKSKQIEYFLEQIQPYRNIFQDYQIFKTELLALK